MLQKQAGYNTNSEKKNIAVLASGSGSNLASIINAVSTGIIENAMVALVISNKKEAYALTRAKEAGINTLYIQRSLFNSDEDYDIFLADSLKKHNIDVILTAGYLRIITKPLLEAYENKILNIHPSLLPDFGGKDMYGIKVHQAVISAKVQESGCTVHLVTEEIDGGPILAQAKVCVMSDDSPEILAARVLAEEHKLFPKAVNEFIKF